MRPGRACCGRAGANGPPRVVAHRAGSRLDVHVRHHWAGAWRTTRQPRSGAGVSPACSDQPPAWWPQAGSGQPGRLPHWRHRGGRWSASSARGGQRQYRGRGRPRPDEATSTPRGQSPAQALPSPLRGGSGRWRGFVRLRSPLAPTSAPPSRASGCPGPRRPGWRHRRPRPGRRRTSGPEHRPCWRPARSQGRCTTSWTCRRSRRSRP